MASTPRPQVRGRALSGLRPPLPVAILGVVALVCYGVAYYAYGVLLEPIRHATGWSETGLGAVFSVVLIVGGVGCIPGGRLADRFGTRLAFLLAAGLGAVPMFASSFAHQLVVFGGLFGFGTGAVGALAFYHVTRSATVRISGEEARSGVVWLTLFGALASPIFLPTTAWLSRAVGWRYTVRIDAVLAAVVLIAAAAVVSVKDGTAHEQRGAMSVTIRRAWHTTGFRRWVLASLIAGTAVDVVLVFQVTIMVSAGLSFGLAATIGGLRGLAQLAGRIGLGPVLRRFGTRATVIASFLLGGIGVLFLLLAGHVPAAVMFCALAGASFGVISTLQGIYTHELTGDHDLGLLLGTQQAIFAGGSALGPIVAGALITATGSDSTVVVLASLGLLAAAGAMTIPTPSRLRAQRPSVEKPVGPACC